VLCPCHLPITFAVIAGVLSGTALGVIFRSHLFLAGGIISITWLVGTVHGFNLMRRARIQSYISRTDSHIVVK